MPLGSSSLRRNINIGFAVALAILCLIGGTAFWSTRRFTDAARERRRSYEIRSHFATLLADLGDAETGQRGYLLTGDESYLAPFVSGSVAVARGFQEIQQAASGDSERLQLATLDPLILAKLAELSRTVSLRRRGHFRDAMAIVNTNQGKRVMDSIRHLSVVVDASERARTERWDARLGATAHLALLTIGSGSLLAVLFGFAAVFVLNRDISKRSQVEAALQDERQRLQQVLNLSAAVIYATKVNGDRFEPSWTSENVRLLTGYDVQEALRSTWWVDHLHPDDRERVLAALPGLLANDHLTVEYRFRHLDGTYRWVHDDARLLRDGAAQPVEIFGAWLDITERVEAEEQIRLAHDAAEAANLAKSDFLAKMSHELRTPLNSIIGFSEVLQDEGFGALNEKQRRYVTNVLTSGRNLLQLINDILDLSKVEAGRMELGLSEFDVAAALAEVRTIVGPLAEQKHLDLTTAVVDALPPITADQGKFKQILYNLVSNAIKFTPDGGTVRVSAGRVTEGGEEWLELAVADSGIGLSPDDQERIFGEFEQVSAAQGREQQGTGLGLSLSQRLVELHGGRIWVESALGKGSTFRFVMPFRRPAVATQAVAREAVPDQGDGPLVLVVEDDRQGGDLLAHHLIRAGYRVAHASSGERALALARELQPAAITLDILLPDGDGLKILAQLKGLPETREIPVVVVSITEARELGFSLGAADWFVKPANRNDFVAAVRRSVTGARNRDPQTILVVDDEPATVELLTDMLSTQGFRVLGAANGREGIVLARSERPDLIVLDLVMPELTGFDVVQVLRDDPACREIPILVFTVKDLSSEEQGRLRGSVKAIVTKGGGPATLLRELARVRAGRGRSI